MQNYVIITDSGCDVSRSTLSEWGVRCIDITFKEADSTEVYDSRSMELSEFYGKMRSGTVFQTSAINPQTYEEAFEEIVKEGPDLIYIGLSSGLSATSGMAQMAAEELSQRYPERRIEVIDSLSGSAGQGLLVYLAAQKMNSGSSFDETADYIRKTLPSLCHWFTVDDLKYLKRGGRIGSAAAIAAAVLDIKPVLDLDDAGRIAVAFKARGRKKALRELAEKLKTTALDPEHCEYIISHADCREDAVLLEELIGHKARLITDIGPVIGSHAGPGTLALFYEGTVR